MGIRLLRKTIALFSAVGVVGKPQFASGYGIQLYVLIVVKRRAYATARPRVEPISKFSQP